MMEPMTSDELLHSMTDVVRKWRREHGEAIAKELIRAYLTGVNDGGKILDTHGAASQHVLYAVLEGN